MSAADGEPAFPVVKHWANGHIEQVAAGMSLRDYFAAKALRGVMQMVADGKHEPSVEELHLKQVDFIAKSSYELADAMLKARQA
jgi:hypothetical protein